MTGKYIEIETDLDLIMSELGIWSFEIFVQICPNQLCIIYM